MGQYFWWKSCFFKLLKFGGWLHIMTWPEAKCLRNNYRVLHLGSDRDTLSLPRALSPYSLAVRQQVRAHIIRGRSWPVDNCNTAKHEASLPRDLLWKRQKGQKAALFNFLCRSLTNSLQLLFESICSQLIFLFLIPRKIIYDKNNQRKSTENWIRCGTKFILDYQKI